MQAYRTEGVTESEGREEANGVGGAIVVRGGNRDENRVGGRNDDVNGGGEEAGAGTATATGVNMNEGAKDGNGDGDGGGDPGTTT